MLLLTLSLSVKVLVHSLAPVDTPVLVLRLLCTHLLLLTLSLSVKVLVHSLAPVDTQC